jgi:hypothetical protein
VIAAGLLLSAVLLAAPPAPASAPDARPLQAFALVLGVNRSVDQDSPPLRYADDDAVRFRHLFEMVGVRTVALARLDDNTRRLHPGEPELAAPRLQALEQAVGRLARDVAAARSAGRRTMLYLVYAGHGKAEGKGDRRSGYVTLEDARLRGADLLARIIQPVGADHSHVIVDACQSYFAVLGRGPGGTSRPLRGFSDLGPIGERPDVGLLLSTSSARESHEWAAFQAGVFSHEVRSGLYGPADADGDGLISYFEIASFVERANASVPNEQYRPDVFAKAPAGVPVLLDLRPALPRRIEVDGPAVGHHYLEDPAGVRWADFHNATAVRLARPSRAPLYLRRASDEREYLLPGGQDVARTSQLALREPHVGGRGAAHELFRSLFSLPFDAAAVESYPTRSSAGQPAPHEAAHAAEEDEPANELTRSSTPPPAPLASPLALGLVGAGAASAIAGAATLMSARGLRDSVTVQTPQDQVQRINQRIGTRNRWGAVLLGAGGAALLGGGAWWAFGREPPVDLAVTGDGLAAGVRGSF